MKGFYREGSDLVCDGVPLESIVRQTGTPVHVYSAGLIRARYEQLDSAFGGYPHRIHYALKANSSLGIVRLFKTLGAGVDANSGGEVAVAARAGFAPDEMVFSGVGKTDDELVSAIDLGVATINAESRGELERIDRLARAREKRAHVGLRVNPDISADTHPHIATGVRTTKFGVPFQAAAEILRDAATWPGLAVTGLHVHVGSQILDVAPLARAASELASLAIALRDARIHIEHLDVGGGLGISYDGRDAPAMQTYGQALVEAVRHSGLTLLVEPGRSLVGPAGALLSTVVDVKPQPGGKWFVIADAGMTELMRPALYGAYHQIVPLTLDSAPDVFCDIVGPLCETSDTLGSNRTIPMPRIGDRLAVLDTGAYGAAMGSNYNRRPLPPEVLVADGGFHVIRRRQTIDDMLQLEQ
jgi:diaminopimelate decarboxylase